MTFAEFGASIPLDLRGKTADCLIDLILNSQNTSRLSARLARSILQHWQSDLLVTQSGLSILLEASFQMESEKTFEACAGLGLTQVAEGLRPRMKP